MDDPGLAKARQAAGGRNADLARLLDISPSAISQWVRVPYRRALQIDDSRVLREWAFRLFEQGRGAGVSAAVAGPDAAPLHLQPGLLAQRGRR